ncbi:hypothetical protein [Actinomadura verrucosospora]|uniref:Uncharacterized protein n=1 Tax=Actinomadura verrucosospora TaxID=46165 RepID=A0A7D3VXF9_ACTVE|nr:hypothetical protein [Actinomadura verrucosospora]QKG24970.1 hypothetical protein ACTIVE_6621 [Actinomadura verrucosospora]
MGRAKTTGYGWVGSVLPLLALVLGGSLGIAAGSWLEAEDVFGPPAIGVLVGEVVAAAVVFLVGFRKNSSWTPDGRVWTREHSYGGHGVQWLGVTIALMIAVLPFSITFEKLTAPGLNWVGLIAAMAVTAGVSRLIYVKTCADVIDP